MAAQWHAPSLCAHSIRLRQWANQSIAESSVIGRPAQRHCGSRAKANARHRELSHGTQCYAKARLGPPHKQTNTHDAMPSTTVAVSSQQPSHVIRHAGTVSTQWRALHAARLTKIDFPIDSYLRDRSNSSRQCSSALLHRCAYAVLCCARCFFVFVCLLGLFVASRHYRALKRCAACCRCANGYSVAVAFAAHVRVRCKPRLQEISALHVIEPCFGAHYALDELLHRAVPCRGRSDATARTLVVS